MIAVSPVIQIEIHVKAAFQRTLGAAPLRYQNRVRVIPVDLLRNVAPQRHGRNLLIIILDQRVRHVHAEAVAAHVKPESHNVLQGFPCGDAVRVIHRKLPLVLNLMEAVVQCGLGAEKVHQIVAVMVGCATHKTITLRCVPRAGRPYIAVGVLVVLRLAALHEPCMLIRGMSRNQIQNDADSLFVGGFKQRLQLLVRAIPGRTFFVIPHIIARVHERAVKAGVHPDRIAAQTLDIVQLLCDARKISDAVPVRIQKTLGINFIKNTVLQPISHTDLRSERSRRSPSSDNVIVSLFFLRVLHYFP